MSFSDHRLLIESDFAGEEMTFAKAREAFAGLENLEHIYEVLDKLEASVTNALAEGKLANSVLQDQHMLFLGPPGRSFTPDHDRCC